MKAMLCIAGLFGLVGAAGPAHAAGDAAVGKAKAEACAACHGARGEGTEGPRLAGKNEAALLQAMQDYKSGKRDDPMMKTLMSKLSDQDLANLAAYYASLK